MKEIKEFKDDSVIINRKGKDQKFLPFTSIYPHFMKGINRGTMFLLGTKLGNSSFLSSVNTFTSSGEEQYLDTYIPTKNLDFSKMLYFLSIKDYLLSEAKPFDLKDSLNIKNVEGEPNATEISIATYNNSKFLECVPIKTHFVNVDKKLILYRGLLINISTNKIVGGVFIDKAQSMVIKKELVINNEGNYFTQMDLKTSSKLLPILRKYAEVWLDYDVYKYLFNNINNGINKSIVNLLISDYKNLRIIKSYEIDSYFFEPEENMTTEDTEKLAKGTLENMHEIDNLRTEKLEELWK